MYIPKSFENNEIQQLHDFIEQYNFATIISAQDSHIEVSHLPIMLDRQQGKYGLLTWHVAKNNPHAKLFAAGRATTCIFHGPHAYISPAWYQTQPGVPTWNYAVVHASGEPQSITSEQLSDDLTRLVNQHEANFEAPANYQVPADYKAKLIDSILGFKMDITQLMGKFKLGQNRSPADQQSMLENLRKQTDKDSLALAAFISG